MGSMLAVLAGLAQAVSIAAPWNGQPLWWLQLLSLAALYTLLARAPRWPRAALLGWLFSSAWLCGSIWWLYVSMHTYGGLAAPLAAAAAFLLAATLALYYTAAAAVQAVLAPRHAVVRVILFTALWTLAELLRGHWFTGFPWAAGGYAHVDGPLSMFAPWVGVYGVGALGATLAAVLALSLSRLLSPAPWRQRRMAGGALLVLLLFLIKAGIGAHCLHEGCARRLPGREAGSHERQNDPNDGSARSTGRLQVALLQGNIPQDQKFVPGAGIDIALRWYAQQLQSATAALVVTPETALPLLPGQLPQGYLADIAWHYAQGGQAAIIGLPLVGTGGYSNSLIGLAPDLAQPYRYDKHHLVPFGEFVPPLFRWFVAAMRIPLGDFHRGALPQPPFIWQGQRIAPNICYEDLFSEEIGAGFRSAALAPTILLNISNLGWFGDTVALDQHLAIARMRAIEFDRPVISATNTGATTVIDHRGRITAMLPRLTRGVLVAEVEGRSGLTFYARWVSRFALAPLWIGTLAVVALVWAARLRRGRRSGRAV
jgi:apolipoprotein N-acyltransferase